MATRLDRKVEVLRQAWGARDPRCREGVGHLLLAAAELVMDAIALVRAGGEDVEHAMLDVLGTAFGSPKVLFRPGPAFAEVGAGLPEEVQAVIAYVRERWAKTKAAT